MAHTVDNKEKILQFSKFAEGVVQSGALSFELRSINATAVKASGARKRSGTQQQKQQANKPVPLRRHGHQRQRQ
jgi:hypothetical protein